MKRKRVESMRADIAAYKDRLAKWDNLVVRYRADAFKELRDNYEHLTGCKPTESVPIYYTFGGFQSLRSDDMEYIFYVGGRLYYAHGDKIVEYPVDNPQYWPWTSHERPVPPLYGNIVMCIAQYMSYKGIAALRLVCKQWREWIDNDISLWASRAERLQRIFRTVEIPCSHKQLALFGNRLYWSRHHLAKSLVRASPNLLLLFGYALVVPHTIISCGEFDPGTKHRWAYQYKLENNDIVDVVCKERHTNVDCQVNVFGFFETYPIATVWERFNNLVSGRSKVGLMNL